ncbi:MAG: hypothetical protein K2H61_07880 [Muribaculaceae bacterium]|nr:hypothetical protein [Muribaculaceae bacterium]
MKSKFTLLGVGSLLILIPMFILLLVEGLVATEIEDWPEDVLGAMIFFTFVPILVGVILSIIGSFGLVKPLKERSVSTGPAITLGIDFIMALPALLVLFLALGTLISPYTSVPAEFVVFLFAIAFYAVAMIACGKLSEYFDGAAEARRGYLVSMIGLGAGFIILLIARQSMLKTSYYYDYLDNDFSTVYRVIFIGICVAFLIGSIFTIKGWFRTAREAAAIEGNDGEEVIYVETEQTYQQPEQAYQQPEQTYQQPEQAAPQMPYVPTDVQQPQVDPYTLQLIEYARTLTAEQLEYVLANPGQYEADFMQICADELARR